MIPAGENMSFERRTSSGRMAINIIEVIFIGVLPKTTVTYLVARAATGHSLPSCRAGKYFLLDQKVFKKSKQNDASTRKATSRPPFCWACARVDII
jgi:hypothetical protein